MPFSFFAISSTSTVSVSDTSTTCYRLLNFRDIRHSIKATFMDFILANFADCNKVLDRSSCAYGML